MNKTETGALQLHIYLHSLLSSSVTFFSDNYAASTWISYMLILLISPENLLEFLILCLETKLGLLKV